MPHPAKPVNPDAVNMADRYGLVPKFYEMNPDEEELLFDGSLLRDGMKILVAPHELRAKVDTEDMPILKDWELEKALERNRWFTISYVNITEILGQPHVNFVARYDNGTKRRVTWSMDTSWYVKLDTIPVESA